MQSCDGSVFMCVVCVIQSKKYTSYMLYLNVSPLVCHLLRKGWFYMVLTAACQVSLVVYLCDFHYV